MTVLGRSARAWRSRKLWMGGITVVGLPVMVWAWFSSDPSDISEGRIAHAAAAPAAAQNLAEVDRLWQKSRTELSGDETSAADESGSKGVWSGREAVQRSLELMQDGCALLERTPGYTATFYRQEYVHGELRAPEVVDLKVRGKPFSVYMKWVEGIHGQELLYVAGQHDNKLIVHPGGWKARLVPAIKLDPEGSMALRSSRYPIYEVGMQSLAEKIVSYRREDLERSEMPECRLVNDQTWNGRDCYFFVLEYPSRSMSQLYRKTLLYIDKELSLPISIRNYTWFDGDAQDLSEAELDEQTLIEHYAYTDISIDSPLAEQDFDPENEAYCFRR